MFRYTIVSAVLLSAIGASSVALAQHAPAAPVQPEAGQASHASDRNCIRDTGSRIRVKKGQCLPVAGRSYSQQDLQRTGETDLGSALQKLDPAITVHGH